MHTLMNGFPPKETDQVTLANWRTPPFIRWAFHHVREIVPSADIANDPGSVWHLDEASIDLSHIRFPDVSGELLSLDEYRERSETDATIVLHKGRVVHEAYLNGMTSSSPHILMSVSKSVLGIVTGIAIAQGFLREDDKIETHVPEVAGTAFSGHTVRDLLDMQAGISFDEDYLAKTGPIVEYRKATNWNPLEPGDEASDLRTFFTSLTEKEENFDGRFHYVSPNSDLLGWVVERASGKRFADYLSEVLWKPLGAEYSAYITVDRLGGSRVAGGICATVRDLARLGLLLAAGGCRNGQQIVPKSWISDMMENGDPDAWDRGEFAEDFPGMAMHYRSKWYVLRDDNPIVFGLGIHGQNVFVDTQNDIVIAQFSSQPEPLNAKKELNTMSMVKAIIAELTA